MASENPLFILKEEKGKYDDAFPPGLSPAVVDTDIDSDLESSCEKGEAERCWTKVEILTDVDSEFEFENEEWEGEHGNELEMQQIIKNTEKLINEEDGEAEAKNGIEGAKKEGYLVNSTLSR